jgi:hypothetical protein
MPHPEKPDADGNRHGKKRDDTKDGRDPRAFTVVNPGMSVSRLFRFLGIGLQTCPEPALPSPQQDDRKAQCQEYEDDLEASVGQLEHVEQRVADFEHQPTHYEIACRDL